MMEVIEDEDEDGNWDWKKTKPSGTEWREV